jgi:hypothetical protein
MFVSPDEYIGGQAEGIRLSPKSREWNALSSLRSRKRSVARLIRLCLATPESFAFLMLRDFDYRRICIQRYLYTGTYK